MSKIATKRFLALWEEILRLEHKSDAELAESIGIRASTVSNWRTGRTNSVRPAQIAAIEKKLNYTIELTKDGRWKIYKLGIPPKSAPGEPLPIYFSMPGHISDYERERYERLMHRLKDIPPGDVERIIDLLDLIFKKK